MKIIDFERKGNMVRFYLGEKTSEWGWTNKDYLRNNKKPDWLKPSDKYYGDDWDDAPYEHNAGTVYEWFIKEQKDLIFDFDDLVLEPCCGTWNSKWCKDDMVAKKIPCIIVIPKRVIEEHGGWAFEDFNYWLNITAPSIRRFYFGDTL